jgi:hypothetical protein
MKKISKFFAALALSAGMLAPAGLSAQERVVKVQGHPHRLLTQQAARKTAVAAAPTDTVYIDPKNIECWIDEPGFDPSLRTDSAYLIIKFTDDLTIDSVFVWGYRWNPYIEHHGIDMLSTVANNDQRLMVMLQYSGLYGHAVGGVGMNWYRGGIDCSRVEVDFNIAEAQKDQGWIDFRYFDDPNCYEGQVSVPVNANNSVLFAKLDYRKTGVLVHPFSAKFGISAYDFDYWTLTGSTIERHWQSGWVHQGYWAYYRADNRRIPIPTGGDDDPDYSLLGVTYEPLGNQQVHGFVFRPSIPIDPPYYYEYEVHQFDGDLIFVDCDCAPCPENVNKNVNTKTK